MEDGERSLLYIDRPKPLMRAPFQRGPSKITPDDTEGGWLSLFCGGCCCDSNRNVDKNSKRGFELDSVQTIPDEEKLPVFMHKLGVDSTLGDGLAEKGMEAMEKIQNEVFTKDDNNTDQVPNPLSSKVHLAASPNTTCKRFARKKTNKNNDHAQNEALQIAAEPSTRSARHSTSGGAGENSNVMHDAELARIQALLARV